MPVGLILKKKQGFDIFFSGLLQNNLGKTLSINVMEKLGKMYK